MRCMNVVLPEPGADGEGYVRCVGERGEERGGVGTLPAMPTQTTVTGFSAISSRIIVLLGYDGMIIAT